MSGGMKLPIGKEQPRVYFTETWGFLVGGIMWLHSVMGTSSFGTPGTSQYTAVIWEPGTNDLRNAQNATTRYKL
ncbi:hypothetical protein M0657_010665 [Pyricularia oryzae]|nr:hypothetical protein M0657_010665 [Pyricularia oryzae]KAI7915755.1 hypothetical protein M9X92_008243 [Pyricularia oryzae]